MEVVMQKSIFPMLLMAVIVFSGCGAGNNPDKMFAQRFDTKIKKLAVLYSTYQARNNWTGPPDDAEFRKYIDSVSEKQLARLGLGKDQIDGLFQSERDDQPYRIRWSMVGGNGVPPKPILFESQGVDGKFLVGFTNGTSQEFSKDDYDKLWAGDGDDGSMIGFSSGASRQ